MDVVMVVVSPFVVGTNDELERSAIVGTRLTNSRPAPSAVLRSNLLLVFIRTQLQL